MPRYRPLRKRRGTSFTSESSLRANRARWSADRARRLAELSPDDLRDLEANPPLEEGSAIGVLEYRDLCTGRIRRWTVRRGDRVDRVFLVSSDGRRTGSHGWSWILDHLRGYLCGRKA